MKNTRMNKIMALGLAGCMAAALSGCGSADSGGSPLFLSPPSEYGGFFGDRGEKFVSHGTAIS